jgi:peptidoglycan hydrolase CwlO-like protein
MAETATVHALLEQLEGDKARLKNSVVHLERSISELKEAIKSEADEDREFKKAIEENIVVIARYKAKIDRLDKEIMTLKQGIQHLDRQAAVPVTEENPPPLPSLAGASGTDEAMPDACNDNPGKDF